MAQIQYFVTENYIKTNTAITANVDIIEILPLIIAHPVVEVHDGEDHPVCQVAGLVLLKLLRGILDIGTQLVQEASPE